MSQKIVNRTTGLVDYKELETNILSSIREGSPLTGRDDTIDKKAAGSESGRKTTCQLKTKKIIEEMGGMQKLYVQAQAHLNC